jgi:HK97 family phage major capsid protein
MDEQSMQELKARREEIDARILELDTAAADRAFNEAEKAEFDELKAELEAIGEKVDAYEAEIADRRALLATAADRPAANIAGVEIRKPEKLEKGRIGSNVDRRVPVAETFDLAAYRKHAGDITEMKELQREGARFINAELEHEGRDDAAVREHVENVLKTDTESAFARRMILAGSPEYEKSFAKLITRGRDALSSDEFAPIQAAISDSGLGSETPVPITIDPTVQLSSDGATNPIRALARTVTIVGNKWRGISSAGVTIAYDAELNEVADQTPDFSAPDIEVVKAHGYVEFSIEVDEDWGALRSELAREFADAKDIVEAAKFLGGSGVNEPQGIITALTASTAPVVVVKTAATATFAIDDPDLVSNALPPRFDPNAVWLASKAVWAKTEALYRAAGNADPFSFAVADIPQISSGQISRIFRGDPIYAASGMDTAFSTSGKNIMLLGDFERGMVIVDRIGMNVELIPLVMGADQRPKGARALYAYFRNNSSVRVANAFRLLQVK